MAHQAKGRVLLAEHREYYGLGCEQGTGKTWMLLADMEDAHANKDIQAALVVAPKGVHTNWILREIPKHLETPVRMARYLSGAGKREREKFAKLLRPAEEELIVLAINVDALNTKPGFDLAFQILKQHDTMMIVDESHKIKALSSARTKRAIALGKLAVSRRISSGTMMDTPPDLFAQFEFLKPGGKLLGTSSERAFTAEFAEVLQPDHPLVMNIVEKQVRAGKTRIMTPQIINRDSNGRKIWRNIDKLRALLQPHVYRVLKSECLDLPPKIFETHFFELEPKQRAVYDLIDKKLRYERDTGEIDTFTALTKQTKLRQVTSGFIMIDGEATTLDPELAAPRLKALEELLEMIGDQQFIVWAVYVEEIRLISKLLTRMEISHGLYYGDINEAERDAAIDDLQSGKVQAFVGNAATGAEGITLTAAKVVVYYSNDWSLLKRTQSEDRSHRYGTEGDRVLYIDITATGTKDEDVADALQSKKEVAEAIMDNW